MRRIGHLATLHKAGAFPGPRSADSLGAADGQGTHERNPVLRPSTVNIKSFVIHLDRATGRRPQVDRLLASLPGPAAVLPAVDGHRLADEDLHGVTRRGLHRPHYPFAMSRSEVACFLSHRRAWRTIIDEGLDAAVIAEDDAAIAAPEFDDVMAAAVAGLEPDEFVRLPHRERYEPGPVVRERDGVRLVEPRLPALGMVMQLVGREAARRLLDASTVFDRPIDSFMQMRWLHGARILTLRPIVVCEIGDQLGGSVIHARRPGFVHRVVHELQRPLIRLAVHRANERWRRRAA
jgi:GR25 family glycosyltransferase involved in LPS biosynthesis